MELTREGKAFLVEKRDAITAARELQYGQKVIEKLENATTIREIDHILCDARRKRIYYEM